MLGGLLTRATRQETPSASPDHEDAPSGRRIWPRLHPLLGDRLGLIVALAVGSVLSGLTESGILAILALVAAALVNGAARVYIDIGPVSSDETIGVLLALALVLSLVRLALQGLV